MLNNNNNNETLEEEDKVTTEVNNENRQGLLKVKIFNFILIRNLLDAF